MYGKDDLFFIAKVAGTAKVKTSETLRRSGTLVILFAQLVGLCPFSLDKDGKMVFKWLSFPVFLVGAHLGSTTFFATKLLILDNDTSRFKTAVDLFQFIIWVASNLASQTYLRLAGILSKQKTIKIWEELHNILKEIHEKGNKSVQTFLDEQLKHQWRKMGLAYFITFACITLHLKEASIPLIGKHNALKIIGVTLWNIHDFLSITKTLWFIHIIDLVRIGYSSLRFGTQANENMAAKFSFQPKGDRLSLFLKRFEALEEVTEALNEKFSVELGVCVLYSCIILNASLYDICNMFRNNEFDSFFALLPQLVIHLIEICLICDSGTWVTKEVSSIVISGCTIFITQLYVILFFFNFKAQRAATEQASIQYPESGSKLSSSECLQVWFYMNQKSLRFNINSLNVFCLSG
jgi:F0F1-type ATP synthase assembly protein I